MILKKYPGIMLILKTFTLVYSNLSIPCIICNFTCVQAKNSCGSTTVVDNCTNEVTIARLVTCAMNLLYFYLHK